MNQMDDILKLLHTLSALPFDQAEITTADFTVKVSSGRGDARTIISPAPIPAPSAPIPAPEPEQSPWVDVASPIIGVFYGAPSPDDEPYVKVGDRIEAGQTLCIIEAMKLMNEVPAPVGGVLRQVLGVNGGEVEVGQVLFRIETAEGSK